jgi:Pyruvate phosphate dikinase, AMP/ATP-binding domain/Lamin Tail Domain
MSRRSQQQWLSSTFLSTGSWVRVIAWLAVTFGCSAEPGNPANPAADAAASARPPGPDAAADGGGSDVGTGQDGGQRDDARVAEPPDVGVSEDAQVDANWGGSDAAGSRGPLVINEVMSRNDGATIDSRGQTGDFIELANVSEAVVRLSDYRIEDANGEPAVLPDIELPPSGLIVLWADNALEAGELHLPFKLDGEGDEITLTTKAGDRVDVATFEALDLNESWARFPDRDGPFQRCRYATPLRANGEQCAPPPPPSFGDDVEFEAFSFPAVFPPIPVPLQITELGLRPAAFIELLNVSAEPVSLDGYELWIAPTGPGVPWPALGEGNAVALPSGTELAPGARIALTVDAEALGTLPQDPAFEGVVTLFDRTDEVAVERVDFMRWPEGAVLARAPEGTPFRFCTNATPGDPNQCDPLASRDVGDRVRYLRTPGDFAALAAGELLTGMEAVKFVVDMEAGGAVHLLSGAAWPLHYTWVRERIYLEPALDRCDAEQAQEFYDGWVAFSQDEYFRTEGRRFLLGTLVHHGGPDLHSVEYTFGDEITAEQMKLGFYSVVPHTSEPKQWVFRPQDASQIVRARAIEGELPLVGPNAPFEGVEYQALTQGIAYGTLQFVPAAELEITALGPRVIVITDDVPNDIPLVGGLITEAFQTPLAHVNVLSQNRNTPNAALADARTKLAPYLGRLVKLEVAGGGLLVSDADPAEAQAYWDERTPSTAAVSPRIDLTVRGIQDLTLHGLASLPAIGAKAAQLAELGRIDSYYAGCSSSTVPLPVPEGAFAIPLWHYREHFESSGAMALLAELEDDAEFAADPSVRANGLRQVRELIGKHPVAPDLLAATEAAVFARFGEASVRFRSSSNTEDLPHFNGAGLYTSVAAQASNPKESVEDAIRAVWASLWNERAYDERRYAAIDDANVAMGVLVHQAYPDEQANGVAVSRNVLDLMRGDIYYVNAQAGEAAVTNPAPGVTSEQLLYLWNRTPRMVYQSTSSLLPALAGNRTAVLGETEVATLACALRSIHDWFRPLLDPDQEDAYFAMEVEFKFSGAGRTFTIKQARPHGFGERAQFNDCREL